MKPSLPRAAEEHSSTTNAVRAVEPVDRRAASWWRWWD